MPVDATVWRDAVLFEDGIEIAAGAGIAVWLLLATELRPLRHLVVLIELIGELVGKARQPRHEFEVAGVVDGESGHRRANPLAAKREEVPRTCRLNGPPTMLGSQYLVMRLPSPTPTRRKSSVTFRDCRFSCS